MAVSQFVTFFPKGNNIRFYPTVYITQPNYNSIPFDQKAFKDQLQPWQTPYDYVQKIMIEDVITIMVHTQMEGSGVGDNNQPTFNLLDVDLNVIAALDVPPYNKGFIQAVDNFYYPNEGSDPIPLLSTLISFQFSQLIASSVITENGIYYIQVINTWSDGSTFEEYRSEPLFVYEVQPNTTLLQYYNNTNRLNIINDGWLNGFQPVFALRIEGHRIEYNPNGVYFAYLQQNYLQESTNSQNWRTWNLVLGGNSNGVPYYLYEKAAEAMIFDNVMLDGQPIVYNSGGSDNGNGSLMWKPKDPKTLPLLTAELPIREKYDNQNVFIANPTNPDVPLFISYVVTDTKSYAIYPFTMQSGATIVSIGAIVSYNDVGDEVMIDYLQNTIKPAYGMLGNFLASGAFGAVPGLVKYINGPGENYIVTGDILRLTNYWEIGISTPGDLSINTQANTLGSKHIVAWNDTSGVNTFQGFNCPPSAVISISHTVLLPTAFVLPIRIFHDNAGIAAYAMISSDVDVITFAKSSGLDGSLPASLETLLLDQINLPYTSSNEGTIGIAPCRILKTLSVTNTNIEVFTPFLFPEISGYTYELLSNIVLETNKLTSDAVDAVFNEFIASTTGIYDDLPRGQFATDNQSPVAPPTSASAAARAILLALSNPWIVATD